MVAAAVALAAAANAADSENDEQQQCMGKPPMEIVATFMGMDLDYELADRICCNNHHYAEPKGYHAWPEVDFYAKLDPTKETVFYDSVCGIPLFVAPRGRTFDEFVEESLLHGWPSFRPAEMVSENVIIHPGGRMESKCLTHLGHNLPKDGIDRYCIDLVCMAGAPPILAATGNGTATIGGTQAATPAAETPETETGTTDGMVSSSGSGSEQDADMDGILSASEFDAATYESSAELNSGKHPKTAQKIGWAVGITAALLFSMVAGRMYVKRRQETRKKQDGSSKQEPASLDEGTNSDNGGSV